MFHSSSLSAMSDTVIQIDNLSKQYRLGLVGTGTLADDLHRWWARLRGKEDPYLKIGEANVLSPEAETGELKAETPESEEPPLSTSAFSFHPSSLQSPSQYVWALKDINLEVKRGEILGIIGGNGAGKSTLLKILSRVTAPTTGRFKLKGRVASLLEVGVGFHPELSGRDNIYLNGAIMGMPRAEVTHKLDEIVDFSGCERYIDTPVKRYSSGMRVRLGFAVAAHLEPEILIVDEVLAVGDVEFRKKCLGKIGEVAKEGRTVLFVSHNMAAVERLCQKGILLRGGKLVRIGKIEEVVDAYLSETAGTNVQEWLYETHGTRFENSIIEPLRLAFVNAEGEVLPSNIKRNVDAYVDLTFELSVLITDLTVGVAVYNSRGTYLFHSLQTDGAQSECPQLEVGRNKIRAKIPMQIFNEGEYRMVFLGAIHKKEWLCRPDESDICVSFNILGGLSESPYWLHGRRGVIAPALRWHRLSSS